MILKIITYLDKISDESNILRESCLKNNINLEYCGLDIPYKKQNNIKIKWMKSYFSKNNDLKKKEKTILIFLDGYDTKIRNNFNEKKIIKKFLEYDCDILLSSENSVDKFDKKKWNIYNKLFDNKILKKHNIKNKLDFIKNIYNKLNYKTKDIHMWCNHGAMIGYYNSIEKYTNIMDKYYNNINLKKNISGKTGDSYLFYCALLDNKLHTKLNIKIEHKKKIFFTYNSLEFNNKDINQNYFNIPTEPSILHVTGCNGVKIDFNIIDFQKLQSVKKKFNNLDPNNVIERIIDRLNLGYTDKIDLISKAQVIRNDKKKKYKEYINYHKKYIYFFIK